VLPTPENPGTPAISATREPQRPDERHKLDRAFVGGVAWTAGAKWISQLVSWPSVLICARLLSPSDFGIVEMAGFYFIVTNIVAEFGVGMAVLQMRELDTAIVSQLNTVALLSGLLAFGISVAAAPLIAAFFRAPELNRLVIVASLSFIMISFETIPLGLLQRDMNYRRLSVAESVQALVAGIVSVGCALAGLAYWALVLGNLVGRAANIALTVYWRPVRFAMPHWTQVMAPLKFGMEIAMQRIVGSVTNLSDSMVIGRTLGQSALGVYRLASNLASAPSDKIGALVMRVTGPLFARVQTDDDLLRRYFLIFSELLSLSCFPLLFGLAIVAPDAVQLLLGSKWAGAAAPLRWLAIFLAVRTMSYLNTQLATTLRLTRYGMWLSLFNFGIMPVGFYVASRYGIGAVAAAWLVLSPATVLPITVKVLRAIDCSAAQYLKSLAPALMGSGAMLLGVIAFRLSGAPSHWNLFARLAAQVAVGGIAYVGILAAFHRVRIMQYFRFFLELRSSPAVAAAAKP
jgi:O-antigen/teichoic acid export membrane protein